MLRVVRRRFVSRSNSPYLEFLGANTSTSGRRFLSNAGGDAAMLRKQRLAAKKQNNPNLVKNSGSSGSGRTQIPSLGVDKNSGVSSGVMALLVGLAGIFGSSIYVSHEVQYNRNGPVAQAYRGSIFNRIVDWADEKFFYKFREVMLPYNDELIPRWESGPFYGEVGNNPPPPLLVLDLERTLLASTHDAKYGWRHVKRPGLNKFLGKYVIHILAYACLAILTKH